MILGALLLGGSALAGESITQGQGTCDDGTSALWAQKRIALDLMLEEVAQSHDRSIRVVPQMAVVDSGFDIGKKKFFGDALSVKRGFKESAEPTEDQSGHGTGVASLVAGKFGIGGIPDAPLSVYRTTTNALGSANNLALALSLDRACADGAEIINYSWGGYLDEKGWFSDEVWTKTPLEILRGYKDSKESPFTPLHAFVEDPVFQSYPFLKQLLQRGCLVVKAAGNDHYRVKRALNLDDAFLRVEASGLSGKLVEFSSNGEVRAPGENVLVLESAQEIKVNEPNRCRASDLETERVNGTSFAAPLASGIAGQVLSYLKKSPFLESVSAAGMDTKPAQVVLINRILKASTFESNINGLRAIRMAKLLRERSYADFTGLPSVEKIQDLFESGMRADPVCQNPPVSDCGPENREVCLNQKRKFLMLCGEVAEGMAIRGVRQKVVQAAQKDGKLDLVFGHLTHHLQDPEIQVSNRRLWEDLRKTFPRSEVFFKLSLSQLSLALGLASSLDHEELSKAMTYLVGSARDYINTKFLAMGENRGGEEFLALYVQTFREIARRQDMNPAKTWEVAKATIRNPLREPVYALRLLGALIDAQPPVFPDGSPEGQELRRVERWFLEKGLTDASGSFLRSTEVLVTLKSSLIRNIDLVKRLVPPLAALIHRDKSGEVSVSSELIPGESIAVTWILSLFQGADFSFDALYVSLIHTLLHFEKIDDSRKTIAFEMLKSVFDRVIAHLKQNNLEAEAKYLAKRVRFVAVTFAEAPNSPLKELVLPSVAAKLDARARFEKAIAGKTLYTFDEVRDFAYETAHRILYRYRQRAASGEENGSESMRTFQIYHQALPYLCYNENSLESSAQKRIALVRDLARGVYARCEAVWNLKVEDAAKGILARALCEDYLREFRENRCGDELSGQVETAKVKLLGIARSKTPADGKLYLEATSLIEMLQLPD